MRPLLFLLTLTLAACAGPGASDLSAPSPAALELSGLVGSSQRASFGFRNDGGGAASYQVAGEAAWLPVLSGGSGTLAPSERAVVQLQATCQAEGLFRATLTFGSRTLPVSLNCATVPAPAGAFGIELVLSDTVSAAQALVFHRAAARWGQVVSGDLPDTALNKPAGACGVGEPAFSGAIDDLVIYATIVPIDGPGGVLAQAGPCFVRPSGQSAYGVMRFDQADVDVLGAQFEAVVLHEMGHVLGVGSLWNSLGLLEFEGNDCLRSPRPPSFKGAAANRHWEALGGSGNAPVEDNGVPGTGCSHWKESVFGNELMTGFLDRDRPNPLSRLTLSSLSDLGYQVEMSAAEPYALPRQGVGLEPLDIGALEVVLEPVGVVLPDGTLLFR